MVKLVNNLKQNFKIKNCTLIFDKCMVSNNHLNFLRDKNLDFITALDRDQIKTLNLFYLSIFTDIYPDQDIKKQLTEYKKI